MDQAAIDYVLAVRALHAGSVIMTHAVEEEFSEVGSIAIKVQKIRNFGDVLSLVGWHDAYSEKGVAR
jgi:hypothetical protein